MRLDEQIRRILKEEFKTPYAVIEITKPISRMDLKYYYQEVPLWHTTQDKIYINRGSAKPLVISTKNIKVLRVFEDGNTQELREYLNNLRNS
jgi:hypothetical protein